MSKIASRLNHALTWLIFTLLCFCTPSACAYAQDQDRESEELDSIVVSGSRIRAGGAQDINHFRSIALEEKQMPRPESLSVEGLLSEHDLPLSLRRPCQQNLCLATEVMPAQLSQRQHDLLFVGLGFTSAINEKTWRRAPLNLIAVVDKSGSMEGEPLDLVRRGLTHVAKSMRKGDQLAIVLYGDVSELYLVSTEVVSHRTEVLAAINNIASAGSTNMESGLKVGFAEAFRTQPNFAGTTRMMLFTDEQPNVGATDPESFMGMAAAASKAGVGMSTIGVGVQFDGDLALQLSSVRGGNLFFVADPQQVDKLFAEQLDTMVSEVAHDVDILFQPRPGYQVSGVFGVPNGLMEYAQSGQVRIRVPTAFMATTAGGVFVTLAKDQAHQDLPAPKIAADQILADIKLAYVDAKTGKNHGDALSVFANAGLPSTSLRKAMLLVEQFTVMRAASLAYHREGKPKVSFQLLNRLLKTLNGKTGLAAERKLVAAMRAIAAKMSGYSGEVSQQLIGSQLDGRWRISADREPWINLKTLEMFEGNLTATGENDALYSEYQFDGKRLVLSDGKNEKQSYDVQFGADQITLTGADGARIVLREPIQ